MEGRSYTEFYRNTSEELFIKAMMESSIGMPAPTMEMLGLKNISQSFRTDSEELFKSWLTNGENNGCHSAGAGHRPRLASQRISADLASLTNQNGSAVQKKPNDDIPFSQTTTLAVDSSDDLNSTRAGVDKGLQASNLFLAKAWFHSSQPMTRSRSSELRRRYAAMQNALTQIGVEAMQEVPGNGAGNFRQEHLEANVLNTISTCENANQFSPFMSPCNSSSTMFHSPQVGSSDKVSSIVSMLKSTLERKKLPRKIENEAVEDSSFGYYNAEEVLADVSLNQGQGIHGLENQGSVQNAYTLGAGEAEVLKTIEESLLDGFMSPLNPTDVSTISREPSQSESSAAAPIASNGFDMSSVCESSRNQMGTERSPEDYSRTKGSVNSSDFRDRVYDNSKDDQKQKRGLIRYGSITSAGSEDGGDPTKRRRVERSRKMAEAKERSSTPPVPSQMQSILKRCENLEKEVRSLKLNLAFMNRKDSEQTKQIEELEKQNQELAEEKERLLEEIERIIAETGKM